MLEVGDNPRRVTAADLNDDGHLDVVTSNSESNCVSILAGRGDGTFEPDVMYGNAPGGIALGDVDGDGRTDVAFTAGGLSVIFNRTAKAGDVNGDGVVGFDDLLEVLSNWD